MATLTEVRVYQDGRHFYREITIEDEGQQDDILYSYPWRVGDGDFVGAQTARNAFLSWCRSKNIQPLFKWEQLT